MIRRWLSETLTSPRAALGLALRVLALFIGFNLLYIAANPIDEGRLPTLYNTVLPGRLRMVWTSGNGLFVSETRIPRMLADITAARPKQQDEYRIFVLGSSETWGAYVLPEETVSAVLDSLGLTAPDGRQVRVYNVAFPVPDGLKDLVFADYFLKHHFQPDLILFALNLSTLNPPNLHPLLLANPDITDAVVQAYRLSDIPHLDDLSQAVQPPAWERHNFLAERGDLAAWLTNQAYGFAWTLTGIDFNLPELGQQKEYADHVEWTNHRPGLLEALQQAAESHQAEVMLYASPSASSAPLFNRWIRGEAERLNLPFLDCRQLLPVSEFTNTRLHITPRGHKELANQIAIWLQERWNNPSMPLISDCPNNQEGK
jgi:hypothetical protein